MRLSIFGLGYVGCVSAGCFARDGHEVIGVDVDAAKVDTINRGASPIVEPGIDELIGNAVARRALRATLDCADAIRDSDLSLVCVGTPSNHNGSLDLTYVKRACQQIGEALVQKDRYHVIALRSTMLPGTTEQILLPLLEVFSGKRSGRDFGVIVNPEFLREGSSIADFDNPPFTIIGSNDQDAAAIARRLFIKLNAPVMGVGIKEAEMIKYTCNCFHALKVTFANEIGSICKAVGADSHSVMDAFCADTKLNLSSYYLKPGFAFGGSCLPKDLRAITHRAKQLDVEVPLLESVLTSNRQQIERAVDLVLQTKSRNVGILGLSFKSGTDDLRESPIVKLIETLLGKGLKLSIYDRDVQLAKLFGKNKAYIDHEIPHISSLMKTDISEVLEDSEVIVIGKKEGEYKKAAEKLNNGHVIIDLVRLIEPLNGGSNYQGLCW